MIMRSYLKIINKNIYDNINNINNINITQQMDT